MRYGDSTVGAAAAYAAVVALLHRELSGEGQFVDVSAVETLSSMIGDCLLEQSLTGKRLGPNGNHHPDMCPHGCYPCADGAWITVAVANDAEWRRLCDVLDATALSTDPRYATLDAAAQARRSARCRPRGAHPQPRCRATGASTAGGRGAGRQERHGA